MDNSEKKNVELNIDNGELKTSMIPEDFTDPQILYDKLISMIKKYHPSGDISQIEKAYKIAYKAHDGQLRKSGEPYIIHPVCVCIILAELELDKETIVAGMLHDVVEDTVMTSEEIAAEFGDEVALLVDGVTKLTQLNYVADKVEVQAENLRKMFLAMAKDIRVILIKLADRLHNQRTMQYQTPEKQKEKSRETLDIYAPIADRLGISKVKVELDDLAFRYLEPEVYNNLVARLDKGRVRREEFIKQIVAEVDKHIKAAGIEATIDGRAKHYFSIYKKMITQNKKLEQIYDLFLLYHFVVLLLRFGFNRRGQPCLELTPQTFIAYPRLGAQLAGDIIVPHDVIYVNAVLRHKILDQLDGTVYRLRCDGVLATYDVAAHFHTQRITVHTNAA